MKPIISVDFDGVIHSYSSGWKGAHRIPDPPVDGAIKWLYDMFCEDRVRVAIFSSRSKSILGRMAMKLWLRKWIIHEYQDMIGPNWEAAAPRAGRVDRVAVVQAERAADDRRPRRDVHRHVPERRRDAGVPSVVSQGCMTTHHSESHS